MTTDPKTLDHERRISQLETARLQLDAALDKKINNPPPLQPPQPPPPAILVEETKVGNIRNEILVAKVAPSPQVLPMGRIKLWVVYQSALTEIEVDGNLA